MKLAAIRKPWSERSIPWYVKCSSVVVMNGRSGAVKMVNRRRKDDDSIRSIVRRMVSEHLACCSLSVSGSTLPGSCLGYNQQRGAFSTSVSLSNRRLCQGSILVITKSISAVQAASKPILDEYSYMVELGCQQILKNSDSGFEGHIGSLASLPVLHPC